MVEPDGSQQAPEQSRRRRDYAPGGKLAAMSGLLEKTRGPLEPPPARRRGVVGVVIAVVVALVIATLAFLAS